MATFTESQLYETTVTDITLLSDELKLVRFRNEHGHMHLLPGQQVMVRVDDQHFRRYALAACHAAEESCSILFYLNGKGPGCKWVTALQVGDPVVFSTETGQLLYDARATHHFFFGDETTLGLFDWYKKIALEENREYFGVAELHNGNDKPLQQLQLMIDTVPAVQEAPGAAAIEWIEQMHPDCWKTWKNATYYLAGRSASIQRMKQYLLGREVSVSSIRTATYWTDGVTGL